MKILFVGHEKDINGASKSLLNIISQLEEQNDVYVLTSFSEGGVIHELKKHKVKILVEKFYNWKVYRGKKSYWREAKIKWLLYQHMVNHITAKKVALYALKEKIDIIHSNTGVINIGGLIHKYSGIPHVWHLREFGDLDFNMFPLMSEKKCAKFMNENTDFFITISKAISQHYDYLDFSKIKLIYNGVDGSNIILNKEYHDKETVFLLAGRISNEKGQTEAISAADILLRKGIRNFKIIFAGKQVEELEIPDRLQTNIKYIGMVKDMPSLRKDIDVELVCSKAEAFGRVTAEAMLGAVPVIGSNSGGTVELIQDAVTGYLYEQGNANDLADKMKIFIENPEYKKIFGKNAQEYAMSHFTIERCVKEIQQLYKKLENYN